MLLMAFRAARMSAAEASNLMEPDVIVWSPPVYCAGSFIDRRKSPAEGTSAPSVASNVRAMDWTSATLPLV